MTTIRLGVAALASAALGVLLLGQTPAGDPARGKAIYEGKGDCQSCHRIDGVGSHLGPDLSDIGVPRELAAAVVVAGKQAAPAPSLR